MEIIDSTKCDRYFFCDPAGGKKGKIRKTRARQAIAGVASDHLHRIFVIHAWAGRELPHKLRDRVIDTYSRFDPRLFGIEANAMQELFGDLVREDAKHKFGKSVRIIPVSQSTKVTKEYRIRTSLEPIINDGRLFVQDKHLDLLSELRGFPTAATVDLVDALASAISLIPKRQASEQKSEEERDLAAYLRKTGMPPHLIERRLASFRAELN